MKTKYFLSLMALALAACAIVPSQEKPPLRDSHAPAPAASTASAAPVAPAAGLAAPPPPYTIERFSLPGPVAGVMAKIDLNAPRLRVEVALADARDPDGDGPCVGQLDTVSHAARERDYRIAFNASFFAVPKTREFNGQKIAYFVGNCGYPQGWHYSGGKLVTRPVRDALRATMIVHRDGHVSLADAVMELPADTRYAVSGNAMMLKNGEITPPARDELRHPRTAVGLSRDGRTLIVLAVDGRQEASRGATLAELAKILLDRGAWNAINLDGGGSTALVVKDPGTGVYAIANQPSDLSSLKLPVRGERPVIDLVGIAMD